MSRASKDDGPDLGSSPGSATGLLVCRANPEPHDAYASPGLSLALQAYCVLKTTGGGEGGRGMVPVTRPAVLLCPEQGESPVRGEGGTETGESCHCLIDPHWVTMRPKTDAV